MNKEKLPASQTAVLYDIENIRKIEDLKEILNLVGSLLDNRPFFNVAYTDWSNPHVYETRVLLQSEGVIPQQVITYGGGVQKNSSDIALCVDAMEVLLHPDIKNYILITGDGGFTSLITKIKKHKKRIEVISVSTSFSETIRGFADEVHTISSETPEEPDETKAESKQDSIIEKKTLLGPNDFSTETSQQYFKNIWAISKTKSTLDDMINAAFKKSIIRSQIRENGLMLSILTVVFSQGKYSVALVKQKIFNYCKNKNRELSIVKREDGRMLIIVSDSNMSKGLPLLKQAGYKGEFLFEKPDSEIGDIKESVEKILNENGIKLPISSLTAEVIDHISTHYTAIKLENKEKVINEVSEALRRDESLIAPAVELIFFTKKEKAFANTLGFTICKKLARLININDGYAIEIAQRVFGWEEDSLVMSVKDVKKYKTEEE